MTDVDRAEREPGSERLGWKARSGLIALTVYDLVRVLVGLRTGRLPDLVRRLERPTRLRASPLCPRRLGSIVDRILSVGPFRPRCLVTSLVFFSMLRRQETAAELVIGLPPNPRTPDAHAWVEVCGQVAGPPPGRLGHSEMARYGSPGPPRDG